MEDSNSTNNEQIGKESNAILNFIEDTKDGKYTDTKPDLTQIIYKRLEIQEQDSGIIFMEPEDEVLLYGISF